MRRRWKSCWTLVAAVVLAAGHPLPAGGEFYRYVDEKGVVHFVDDLGQIPAERQEAIETYMDSDDHLSPDQLEKRRAEERKRIELEAAAEQERREKERQTAGASPVVIAGNQVLVPAIVSYKGRRTQITFLLDTGASVTTVHKDAAGSLRIYGGIPSRVQVVGGKTVPSRIVVFDYIQVGPLRVENIHGSVLEHRGKAVQYGGLLGMNFLRHADYQIDFDRQLIRWLPRDGQR
ncbi:MAG: aspartyl protease family protein [Desulfobacterales bacterium]